MAQQLNYKAWGEFSWDSFAWDGDVDKTAYTDIDLASGSTPWTDVSSGSTTWVDKDGIDPSGGPTQPI